MQEARALRTAARIALTCAAVLGAIATASPSRAWLYDQNHNRIDDRIESVNANGIDAAYENGNPSERPMIGVSAGPPITYRVYVGYDHHPSALDAQGLGATGASVLYAFHSIDYLMAQATYPQIQLIVAQAGVTRVTAVQVMYALNHYGSRVVRARDSRGISAAQNYVLFPSARQELGLDGQGVVIAILDTGVNDSADVVNPGYPGHESLRGKYLGGGDFSTGVAQLSTPLDGSINPSDHGAQATEYHATHVAGTALGTGGETGFFAGVAPGARLVDCKVLTDAGATNGGDAVGLDWCIANRHRAWPGLTGPDTAYRGIQIASMSLGCIGCTSDGTDPSEAIVDAAVDSGLVVVIATGNDGNAPGIAVPAGAGKSIAVGATNHNLTLDRHDDTVTSFSNEGPRTDNGDQDHSDEMKPSVVTPGAGIVSADGDVTTSGRNYKVLNGTSMSTPCAAGVCALILQANRGLHPLELRGILQNTAEHFIPSVKGPFRTYANSNDPNYDPGSGWGEADAYAACKEALNSTSGVQVVQILRPLPDLQNRTITFGWITQREYPFLGFDVYRAPDVGGAPGTFAQINAMRIAPAGHSSIAGVSNRTPYNLVDADPSLEIGKSYWYRVNWVDLASVSHAELPVPIQLGTNPRVATVYYSITHDSPDNDLFVRIGETHQYSTQAADRIVTGPGTAQQDSMKLVPADLFYFPPGHIQHFWSIPFTAADNVTPVLPPSHGTAWFLDVAEGGFVDQDGRLDDFSMFVNDSPGSSTGTTYVTNSVTPMQTAEGQHSTLWIPERALTGVGEVNFAASAEGDGVQLTLRFAFDATGSTATVYRSASDDFASRERISTEALSVRGTEFQFTDEHPGAGTNWYWVVLQDARGRSSVNGPVSVQAVGALTFLEHPAPNPTRGGASFTYFVGRNAGHGGVPVSLALYDLEGRQVRSLVGARQEVGRHQLSWDGRGADGARLRPGSYFLRLKAGPVEQIARLSIVR